MKAKIVRKEGKYKKRYSLDVEDWVVVIIVALVLGIALINLILWQ